MQSLVKLVHTFYVTIRSRTELSMLKPNKSVMNTSLFTLTWPILVELILQMLIGSVDQFMLASYSDNAVAAIGNVNQILNVLIITFGVISLATTIMVSQALGAGQSDKISEIYSVAFFSNLVFSIVISAILFGFGTQIFNAMQLPPDLMEYAMSYMSIVGGFIFLQACQSTFSAIFRSNGMMKQIMFVSIAINIVNIMGNFLLIHGVGDIIPAMGVTGVAVSSVISRLVGCAILWYLFNQFSQHRISIASLKPFPKDTFFKMLKIGLPTGGESMAYNVSQLLILTIINTMGTFVVVTKAYASIIVMFSWLYASAVSQASQIIVGHLIGAGKQEIAQKQVLKTTVFATVICVALSILLFLLAEPIFSIFTSNPDVIRLGKQIMFVEIFLEAGRAVNLMLVRACQAAGDIKFPVLLGVGCMWGIAVLLSYILGVVFGWGLVGIWIAMALDECIRAVVLYFRWKSNVWKTMKVL